MKDIVLCGFMGSGKSTIGKNLAIALNYEFADMDSIIEEEAGKTISEIFESAGEASFRKMEAEVAKKLAAKNHESSKNGIIISTGGGFMTSAENASIFPSDRFEICFVDRDFDEIWEELKNDNTRPLAKGKTKEELKKLYDDRLPLYKKYSSKVIK